MKTVQYWGAGNIHEGQITGKSRLWYTGMSCSVEDTDATSLLAYSSDFRLDQAEDIKKDNVVTATANPLTGGSVIYGSDGKDLLLSVGLRQFLRACFPCNQTGTASNLPKDYSVHAVQPVYGVNLSTPWATAGYLQTPGGSNQHVDLIPLADFTPNMFTDSWAVAFTVKMAAPGADAAFIGNGATSTNRGFYLNKLTTGKLSGAINTNTGPQYIIGPTTATVFDNTPHQVIMAVDAPSKMLYIYVDGVLDFSVAFTITADTAPIGPLVVGRAGPAGNAVSAQVYGVAAFSFPNSALPVNMDDLAAAMNRSKRAPGMSQDLQAFF